jgi:hypothetical protein
VSVFDTCYRANIRIRNYGTMTSRAVAPCVKFTDWILLMSDAQSDVFSRYNLGTGARAQSIDDLNSINQWAPEHDRFWIMVAQLQDPETTDLPERAGETHQLAHSKVQVNSQAYLFLRKQSLQTR